MIQTYKGVPLLAVTAESGSGKTTLLTRVIPILKSKGLKIGCLKHTHHHFDLDKPGKDSYKIKAAGVDQMLLGDAKNWALIVSVAEDENNLESLLSCFKIQNLDLILVEGFKNSAIPQISVHRGDNNISQFRIGQHTIAIATNAIFKNKPLVPTLNLDNPTEIASFIVRHVLKLTEKA